jgi:hypothetical protein
MLVTAVLTGTSPVSGSRCRSPTAAGRVLMPYVAAVQVDPALGRLDQPADRAQQAVFPQSLGPTRIIVFPSGTSRLSPSTATVPSGFCFFTYSKVITEGTAAQRDHAQFWTCLLVAENKSADGQGASASGPGLQAGGKLGHDVRR